MLTDITSLATSLCSEKKMYLQAACRLIRETLRSFEHVKRAVSKLYAEFTCMPKEFAPEKLAKPHILPQILN